MVNLDRFKQIVQGIVGGTVFGGDERWGGGLLVRVIELVVWVFGCGDKEVGLLEFDYRGFQFYFIGLGYSWGVGVIYCFVGELQFGFFSFKIEQV